MSSLPGHPTSISSFSRRAFLGTAAMTAAVVGTTTAAPRALAETPGGSRFTLGVLPDTQFYSRYATPETGDLYMERAGSEPFITQTQWIVEHDEALNMPFTLHLGDVVDQSWVEGEWVVADEAMRVLEQGGAAHSVLPGNHDYGIEEGGSVFERWFGADRAAQQSTYVDARVSAGNEVQTHLFTAEGQQYLNLALAWRADDAALAWAQQIIDQHPGVPTIITAHEIMSIGADGAVFPSVDYGQHLFDILVAPNDQVFLTLSGHHHGAGVQVLENAAGHDVVMVLQDYQMAYQGGNGLLGVLELDLSGGRMRMNALSPWVAIKPQESLTQFDHLILEGESDSWTVPFDFVSRFTALDPAWTLGTEDRPDYSVLVREIVSKGYVPPTIEEGQLPLDADDYPAVEGTVAHWRPGQLLIGGAAPTDGQVVPVGTGIPDVAEGADLFRADLNSRGATGAAEDDVVWSADHHNLSSDAGSVRFLDANNGTETRSWFATVAAAAVNDVRFENGYTFETFLKIDADWSADRNAWMGAIARDGQRGDIRADIPEGEEPPTALAVSSLRELQWTSVATSGSTDGTSNWSHEVPKDSWLHVAIVNDAAANTIEMFVDDAPILRDVIDATGMEAVGQPWILGANMWAGDPANGWLGWIGETRLVEGALAPEQWLTARSHDSAGSSGPGKPKGQDKGNGHGRDNAPGRSREEGPGPGNSDFGTSQGNGPKKP